ncbi:hypothetical protein [Paenibacillus crassostreae]|uniref:Glycosyltransferase RgtA/B/C/D-like domain-containing protein n=1 Tax=Paenibacillus crassostreae TaxID=1763538 RepID=A0A167E2B6_9BACL|nr:hypothetical protein [Paenibacillus crassostreae]AOZ93306.1 hypothetical protein LPB68_14520 [Paenibacillus crassostreae]OAB75048.1 hypothetical protein PNBC_09415 [Paenibacillus crassostreae]
MFNINKKKLITLSIYSLATGIFIYYLNLNYRVNYYDEIGYVHVSKLILNDGLFNINEPLRTYLYPLIISMFSMFSNGDIAVVKIMMSIFQFIVYQYTVKKIANTCLYHSNNYLIYYSILFFGAFNLYLIQSTTLLLTDLLASCLIILSLLAAIFDDCQNKINYKIFAFIYAAIMIRPSSIIFLPIILVILVFRKKILNNISYKNTLIAMIMPILIIFPQLYNNIVQFNHWTPLIHMDLYEFQSKLAATYLKYGTVVIPNEEASLVFRSPFLIVDNTSIYELMSNDFIAFISIFMIHVFGVLDWGYVDTYIRNFYPITRVPASLYLYLFWILSGCGLYRAVKHRKRNVKEKFIIYSLVLSFLGYCLFLGTTVIEARFGYPLFLIALPFAGFGVQQIVNNIFGKNTKGIKLPKYLKLCLIVLICIIILILLLKCSFLLDSSTGRINWTLDNIF